MTYFAGAPDDRPSIIDHGAPDRRLHYGLIAPGFGYKIGEDAAQPDPWDPDRPDRPINAALRDRLAEHVKRMFPGRRGAHHRLSLIHI